LHHRHRHPFHAAGGARQPEDRVLPPRQADRGGKDRRDLHQSRAEADARLHHGPHRLSPGTDIRMSTSPNEHIVSRYEDELTNLAQSISEMGGEVEAAVSNAVRALLKLDHALARANIANDKKIDEMQRRIDETAVTMIARRQPMARDLRDIITAIHVANDQKRVGDMAKTITRRALQIERLSLAPKFYNGVKHMSDLILRQLKAALDAYSSRNAQAG